MEWTSVHIEAAKENCLKYMLFNQPIPQEVLDNIQTPSDNSSDGTKTNPIGVSQFTPERLKYLRDVSCLNDCNGNGQCESGMHIYLSISLCECIDGKTVRIKYK